MSNYFLKLEQFEGPLDLLLHLVRFNEIDIFNIDIAFLTQQYLEYLRLVKFDNLHEAGEFIEMAAILIEMKSRKLLPHDEEHKRSADDEEDPIETLQKRLIEYEAIRRVAEQLSQRPQLGQDIQTNSEWQRLLPDYQEITAPLKGDPASLVILYEQLMRDLPLRKKIRVQATMHAVSVEDKIKELKAILDKAKFMVFQGFYKKFESRYEMVVYILAFLEMSRWRQCKIYQTDILGPIWLYHMDFEVTDLPLTQTEKATLLDTSNRMKEQVEEQGELQ